MKELKRCSVCGSPNVEILYRNAKDYHTNIPGIFTIYECKNCGLYFLNPMLNNNELSKCYEYDYYSYNNYIKDSQVNVLRKLWRKIIEIKTYTPKLPPKAMVLDVGCGSGEWLYQMKRQGFQVYGCDVSMDAVELGNNIADLNIFCGQLIDNTYDDNIFDFIRLNHSFEHMNNPNETLNEIHRILKKEGLLFIGVPNTSGLWNRMFKEYWYYLGAPIHVYNYSARNLCYLLKKHGFKIIKVKYKGNFYGLAGSIQFWGDHKLHKNVNTKIFYPVCKLIAFIMNCFHLGDCIEVIAMK